MFSRQELRHVLVTVIFLGLIFGFDDGSTTFDVSSWFLYLLWALLLSGFFFLVRLGVQKRVGDFYDALVEYRLWFTRRYGVAKRQVLRRPIPLGILAALLVTLASAGQLFVTCLGHLYISPKLSRLGRGFAEVTEFEESLISFSGVAVHLGFMVLFSWLSIFLGVDFSFALLINSVMLFFLMIPIPPLEGGLMFFGSRHLYVFSVAFCLAAYSLLFVGPLLSLVLGLLIGAGVLLVYHYKWEF